MWPQNMGKIIIIGGIMSREVPWNKLILEEFIKEALLTKEEEMIIRTRIAGWTRTKQSLELEMSLSTNVFN